MSIKTQRCFRKAKERKSEEKRRGTVHLKKSLNQSSAAWEIQRLLREPPSHSARVTHWLRSICNAFCRGSFISCDTFSPRWAKQSSTELSGLAGLNTGEVWRSKPVLVKAEDRIKEKSILTHNSKSYREAPGWLS